MAEFLSPGIFIEEVSLTGATVSSVGTSTMAIVGFTKMGPVDTATLVTSPDDFQRKFGGFSNDTLVPLSVSAYFGNGGTRAYVARVVPTDAIKAENCISDAISNEILATSDGSSPFTIATATLANIPVKTGTAVVSWRNDPAGAITGEDPTFTPTEAEATEGPYTGAALANIPLTDATVTLNWSEAIQSNDTFFFNINALDTESITLDSRTYVFNTVVGGADSILIGASISATIDNLVAAITDGVGGAGEGTTYGTGTVAHATSGALNLATASAPYTPVADTMLAFFSAGGVAGDGKVVSETITDALSVWSTGSPGAYVGGGAAAAKVVTIDDAGALGGADVARVASASIDRDTGIAVITLNVREIGVDNGPEPSAGITVDYDFGGSLQTVTDNGAGSFSATTSSGTGVTGSIDYATGEITDLVWDAVGTDQPFSGNDIAVSYDHCQWELNASNEGAWGNTMTLRLEGNENFFTSGTSTTTGVGTYSKFDLTVFIQDDITGADLVRETFEEIVFDDVDDALYFPDLLNEASDFIDVTDSGTLGVPSTFAGITRTAEIMGAGDDTTIVFTGTLSWPALVKTSLVITYTPTTGAVRTLVSDVNGEISGSGLDTTKTNTVDFTTGAFTLNFLAGATNTPKTTTNITGTYVSLPTTSSVDYVFTGGSDGTVSGLSRTDVTSPALSLSKGGIFALDRIDEMMQLVIPDFAGDTTVYGDELDYAESRRDIFVILSTPSGFTAQQAVDFKRITFPRKSKFSAYYWPWIRVADPLADGKTVLMPPMAHIAGVYARTDNTKNVGKAPGGTVDGALRFLTALEKDTDKAERDVVYPARINPLINTPQTGLAVWGVRTASATNDAFKYINAVRLFMFVEKSVFNSTHGLLFESINSNLYGLIKTQLDGFLLNLFNEGHFAGNSPSQAFFVIVDETNNPPAVVNAGQVIVDVGIAPNTPGEFIRFRFAQKTLTA